MSGGFLFSGQQRYNGYYPRGVGNSWYPSGCNIDRLMLSGAANPRTGGNIGGPSPIER
ncbi:unnamed protein product, partial [Rotaria sp. Silwood1]